MHLPWPPKISTLCIFPHCVQIRPFRSGRGGEPQHLSFLWTYVKDFTYCQILEGSYSLLSFPPNWFGQLEVCWGAGMAAPVAAMTDSGEPLSDLPPPLPPTYHPPSWAPPTQLQPSNRASAEHRWAADNNGLIWVVLWGDALLIATNGSRKRAVERSGRRRLRHNNNDNTESEFPSKSKTGVDKSMADDWWPPPSKISESSRRHTRLRVGKNQSFGSFCSLKPSETSSATSELPLHSAVAATCFYFPCMPRAEELSKAERPRLGWRRRKENHFKNKSLASSTLMHDYFLVVLLERETQTQRHQGRPQSRRRHNLKLSTTAAICLRCNKDTQAVKEQIWGFQKIY